MKFLFSAVAALATVSVIQAGIVHTPEDVAVAVSGGYRWSWTLTLDGDDADSVSSAENDYVVIYDFFNYVPNSIFFVPSSGGATWTASVQNSGPYPEFSAPIVLAQDNPDIPNLVLTLTAGSLTIVDGNPIEIGEFGAISTTSYGVESLYATDGLPGSQNDWQPATVPGVPEPTSIALAASGLGALLYLRRRQS